MCGIFGLVQSTSFKGAELRAMSRVLRHRGPDDEGFVVAGGDRLECWAGDDSPVAVFAKPAGYLPAARLTDDWNSKCGGVALGHRRLAIVDLSTQGHQPMSYRERYWMTYNGEVYNYLELREELQKLGHQFKSVSDSEVILAAYVEWGPACLQRFNGMWALAIFDREEGTLFIARDRFGVKPLYYLEGAGRFAFASEIKAFTVIEGWKSRMNIPRLLDYLVWNVMDHTAETMFEGVKQLPGGHYLLIPVPGVGHAGARSKVLRVPVRWYFLPEPAEPEGRDRSAELRRLLDDAVRLRLRSDVPVGSCLSGGLDSSSIVCLMSRQLSGAGVRNTLRTFTAQSSDAQFDETRYAEAVIEATGAHASFVNPSSADLFAELDGLIWQQDEPVLSSSNIAQRHVFRVARELGAIVMLDGQGADEILCGYRGFFGAFLAGLARRGRWNDWWRETGAMQREIGFSRRRSLGYTLAYLRPGLRRILGRFDRREADFCWIAPARRAVFDQDPLAERGGRANSIREMSVGQLLATNLPMLLHWEDRNSMSYSVEARVPFLDYRVVEFCLQLSDEEKVGGGVSKAILRRAMRGLVPDMVLDRRDKMGFLTAEPLWITRDSPQRFRAELVSACENLRGIVDPSIVARFDELLAGRRPYDPCYWRVICAARWMQTFQIAS